MSLRVQPEGELAAIRKALLRVGDRCGAPLVRLVSELSWRNAFVLCRAAMVSPSLRTARYERGRTSQSILSDYLPVGLPRVQLVRHLAVGAVISAQRLYGFFWFVVWFSMAGVLRDFIPSHGQRGVCHAQVSVTSSVRLV